MHSHDLVLVHSNHPIVAVHAVNNKMAASNTGGYEYEFLESVEKLKEFECPLCLLVTRDPSLTDCCGQHFCQSCIGRIVNDGNPCSFCKAQSFVVVLDKKQRRKVYALKVACMMKKRGCGWTGELGELNLHLDVNTGSCLYIDVRCTNSCGETLKKCHLDKHLLEMCPKREFSCEYCGFKATYEDVHNKHEPICVNYPLPCPNACEVSPVERGKLEQHLTECSLQLVECQYAAAGCMYKVQRKDLASHLEQNLQQHLAMVSIFSFNTVEVLHKEMQSRLDEKETKIERVQAKLKKTEGTVAQLQRQLAEKEKKIGILETQVKKLQKISPIFPPLTFIVSNFSEYKDKDTCIRADGPTFYTHLEGCKLWVRICFGHSGRRRMDVELWHVPGAYDGVLHWPVKCTVTAQVLNCHGDHDHITGSRECILERTYNAKLTPTDVLRVNYSGLEIDEAIKKIRYVENNRLHFKITVQMAMTHNPKTPFVR